MISQEHVRKLRKVDVDRTGEGLSGAKQAAEKLGNLDKAGGKRPSGAEQAAEKVPLKALFLHRELI